MEKKTGIFNTFIRYGKLLFVFLKMSLMAQLEYRINFAAGVLVETGWLLIKLLYVAVVYRAGIKIGVLTPDHILLFIGVYILLTGVYMLYYPNFTSLTTMIRDGKLDMYLVKPVAAQFLVTMQRLDLSLLVPDAAAGIVMIGIGWHRAGLPVTVGSIAGFLFFLVFWTTATNGIADLTAAVWDFNNMPQLIYGKWMQRVGTFLLPVFVITNFPGLFLMGELSAPMAVWGVAAPIVFFLIARAVWNQAVKNYTSAST